MAVQQKTNAETITVATGFGLLSFLHFATTMEADSVFSEIATAVVVVTPTAVAFSVEVTDVAGSGLSSFSASATITITDAAKYSQKGLITEPLAVYIHIPRMSIIKYINSLKTEAA